LKKAEKDHPYDGKDSHLYLKDNGRIQSLRPMAPSGLAKSPVTSLRQGRIGMHWKLMHREESI